MTSYRITEHLRHLLRHTALCYVTTLEYRVIENHLSASGLRLAPHLTHAPSVQAVGRGAGDTPAQSQAPFEGFGLLNELNSGVLPPARAFPDASTPF